MAHDEIIKEVRAIREAYAERFDFDIHAIYRDAEKRQEKTSRDVVELSPRPVPYDKTGEDSRRKTVISTRD